MRASRIWRRTSWRCWRWGRWCGRAPARPGLALVFLASVLGGGAAFAAFGPLGQPMVGVSAALFGLAGALMVWQARASWQAGRRPWDMLGLAAALMAANLLSAWAVNWQMAWEAHAGGFVAGGLAALAFRAGRRGTGPRRHLSRGLRGSRPERTKPPAGAWCTKLCTTASYCISEYNRRR
jgi:membrane associated rhomboid family serine protease